MLLDNEHREPFGRGKRQARNLQRADLDLRHHAVGEGFVNSRFGRKEPVDIGRRHIELAGNVGDGCFGVAHLAEQPLSRIQDARPRVRPQLRRYRRRL